MKIKTVRNLVVSIFGLIMLSLFLHYLVKKYEEYEVKLLMYQSLTPYDFDYIVKNFYIYNRKIPTSIQEFNAFVEENNYQTNFDIYEDYINLSLYFDNSKEILYIYDLGFDKDDDQVIRTFVLADLSYWNSFFIDGDAILMIMDVEYKLYNEY